MKCNLLVIASGGLLLSGVAAAAPAYYGPFSNQPLALSWDQSKLAVVNPEAGTVTVFQVAGDANTKTTEAFTGKVPVVLLTLSSITRALPG